jgi:hypothetical protein
MKRFMSMAAILLATSGLIAGGATASQAASKDGVIQNGEFVQWYFSGYNGGCEDDYYGDSSFYNDYFKNCGQGTSGVGALVANNAESDYNYDFSYTAHVCTGVNSTGTCSYVSPRTGGTFNSTFYNRVQSLYWTL